MLTKDSRITKICWQRVPRLFTKIFNYFFQFSFWIQKISKPVLSVKTRIFEVITFMIILCIVCIPRGLFIIQVGNLATKVVVEVAWGLVRRSLVDACSLVPSFMPILPPVALSIGNYATSSLPPIHPHYESHKTHASGLHPLRPSFLPGWLNRTDTPPHSNHLFYSNPGRLINVVFVNIFSYFPKNHKWNKNNTVHELCLIWYIVEVYMWPDHKENLFKNIGKIYLK